MAEPQGIGLNLVRPPSLPKPVGPYSHGATVAGIVFCAGQLALDHASTPMTHLSAGEQTAIVLRNLEATLRAAGSSLQLVVRTTVYLSDLAFYAEMNEAYIAAFGDHRPARATVEVSGLIGGLSVEIDAIAVQGGASQP
jgi:2-iminobutanoate/2-iminopropanoate deaminase